MKKVFFALALALFLFSCDDGGVEQEHEDLFSGDNPFVGTWVSTNSVDFGGDAFMIIFSEIKFENDVPNTFILKDGELYDYKQDYPIIGKFRSFVKDINGKYQQWREDLGYVYTDTHLQFFSYHRVNPDWPIFIDPDTPYNFNESKMLAMTSGTIYKKVSKQTF